MDNREIFVLQKKRKKVLSWKHAYADLQGKMIIVKIKKIYCWNIPSSNNNTLPLHAISRDVSELVNWYFYKGFKAATAQSSFFE
jgi:hypothetical protein